MGKQFWKIVNKIIESSDLILEVVDSRFPMISRNEEIEAKIKRANKQLIIVMNKCDLISKFEAEIRRDALEKIAPTVFMDTREKHGTTILRRLIMRYAQGKGIRIGVVGYPNTGKSSIINALRGKAVARTSPVAGFTKGYKYIKLHKIMTIIDTPGVYPFEMDDDLKLALFGAKNPEQFKDPEHITFMLMDKLNETAKGLIERFYGVNPTDDPEELLESIAIKKKKVKKGEIVDTRAAAVMILHDWQSGKISMA